MNLMGHQKAAFEMLTRLYTPQSITESDFLLKVILWYIRFDLFVGFQSGGEAVLGREWYEAVHQCYVDKLRASPDDKGLQYEERFAHSRLVAKDSNDLFARTGKGLISPQEFMAQLPVLKEKVDNLQKDFGQDLIDPRYKVEHIPGETDPDDIVDPHEPNIIWGGSSWTSNYLLLDTWGIIFMFNISASMALRQPFSLEVTKEAYKAVQVFEAMCAYPDAPPGTLLEAQVCFAIATLFLPKDAKTVQWCRRVFAKIEAAGYVYTLASSHWADAKDAKDCSCALYGSMLMNRIVIFIRMSYATACSNLWALVPRTGGYPTMKPAHRSFAPSKTSSRSGRKRPRTRSRTIYGR